jgi:hypothetical protein
LKESVTGSDAYKNTHSSLSKPALAAAAAGLPKKSTEVKKEDKAEAKEEKKEAKEEKKEEKKEIKEEEKEEKAEVKEEKKEEKKARKSRSASRKRNSIFGSIGFGKKEEKVEPKEETPAVVAPEETAVSSDPSHFAIIQANQIIHRLLLNPLLPWLQLKRPQLSLNLLLLPQWRRPRLSRPSLLLPSATASSDHFNPSSLLRRRRLRRHHLLSQPRMLSLSLRVHQ